ncbi:MAG: M1 family metallopeptidase [Myxococcota bacterium]
MEHLHLHLGCARCLGLARGPFDLTGSKEHYPPDAPFLPAHISLDVRVDLEAKTLEGVSALALSAVRPGLRELTLDAREMEVRSVEGAASFTHEGGKIHVTLPEPTRAAGQRVELWIRYRVVNPRLGLYFVGPDAGYPDKPRQAWTQSQDDDAPYWFPCLDAPRLKATSEVRCTVKKGLRALSNGALIAQQDNGDTVTWHHRLDVPHSPYLMTLVVGEFAELKEQHGALPVRYFVTPGREDEARRSFGNTPRMIAFFERILGVPYPYPEYTQVAVADFVFGGMENTGCTTQTDRTLHDERAHLDFTSDELVAHELAHQWFGDLVTCRTWSEAWLNEGFATYFASLWYEEDKGKEEFLYDLWLHARSYFDEDGRRYRRPIVTRRYQEPIDLFDRHLYEKGARVLHMLRVELGDTLFFGGLKRYLQRHAKGPVTTDDLCRALEEESGRSLERFFDDWVRGAGHPEITVDYSYDADAGLALITIKQEQRADEGAREPRRWHLSVPVRIHCGDQVITQTLKVERDSERFPVAVPKRPTRVVVDPDDGILKTVKLRLPEELLIAQLKEDPSCMARIRAAFALQDLPTIKSQDALFHALCNDGFWGVQADCATALGEMKGPRALQLLLDALPRVKHPKARRAVVRALGNWRNDDAAAALAGLLEQGDPSYFAEADAATALGRTRAANAVPTLKRVLDSRQSWLDVVRAGCVTGLGETREMAAYDVVRAWAAHGKPINVRMAAFAAMARLGENRAEAGEIVVELERYAGESDFRVLYALLGAAQTLNEPVALGWVDRLMRQGPDGRIKRRAEEVARTLRAGKRPPEGIDRFREELDKLKEENRGLRERVQALEARLEKKPEPAAGPKPS